jgi:hypothetical protein
MYWRFTLSRFDRPNLGTAADARFDVAILPNCDLLLYAPGPGIADRFDSRSCGTCGLRDPEKVGVGILIELKILF